MKDTTKMGLGAVVMILLSLFYIYLVGFSDQITEPVAVAAAAAVAAVVVAAAVAVAGAAAAAVVAAVAVVAVAGAAVVVAVAVAVVAAGVTTWDKEGKEVASVPFFLLMIIFVLPLVPGVYYTSHYHNGRQLVRDQKVTEVLEVTKKRGILEVKLPEKHVAERKYLRQVLYLRLGNEATSYSWRKQEICCREGRKIWYKAEIPFTENASTTTPIWAYFDHVYDDWEARLTIKP